MHAFKFCKEQTTEFCIDKKQANMQILPSKIPKQRKNRSSFSKDTVLPAMGKLGLLASLMSSCPL